MVSVCARRPRHGRVKNDIITAPISMTITALRVRGGAKEIVEFDVDVRILCRSARWNNPLVGVSRHWPSRCEVYMVARAQRRKTVEASTAGFGGDRRSNSCQLVEVAEAVAIRSGSPCRMKGTALGAGLK